MGKKIRIGYKAIATRMQGKVSENANLTDTVKLASSIDFHLDIVGKIIKTN